MPAIPFNRVVDVKRIIRTKWWTKEEERHIILIDKEYLLLLKYGE
jgi:hypothetical protein